MTKKLFLLLILSIMSSATFSQNITESDLFGVWKVKNAQANTSELSLSEEQIEYIDKIRIAYSKAFFEFKENKEFKIEISNKEIGDKLKNACWKFETQISQIIVVDCSEKDLDNGKLSWEFPINVSIIDEKTFFILEPIFNLEMEKIQE